MDANSSESKIDGDDARSNQVQPSTLTESESIGVPKKRERKSRWGSEVQVSTVDAAPFYIARCIYR